MRRNFSNPPPFSQWLHINNVYFSSHLFPNILRESQECKISEKENRGIICQPQEREKIRNEIKRENAIQKTPSDYRFCSEGSFSVKEH